MPPTRPPLSTYRVQLHPGFTFDHLAGLVPALHELGVSYCYCSPIFRPTPGSLHGYDVCDYELVNPEIGGEAGLRRLSACLREHDMGLLLDFVPNHMGIDGPLNRWWRDVLEHGRGSDYADFFDIHWNELPDAAGRPRVFAPLLPDHYGMMLERGELRLVHEGGVFALAYGEARLPLRPETQAELRDGVPAGGGPDAEAAIAERLRRHNGTPGDPGSFDALDRMIGGQHYRLARWQAGAHGTNYRRFFAIDTLVGLRMEDARVFERVHAKLRELIREGLVNALRIDHIDGLRDPAGYLERVQTLAGEVGAMGGRRFPVYVEKIVAPGERLPADWLCEGTTGYEFVDQAAGLFTDPRQESAFDAIYAEFTGRRESYEAAVVRNKRLVLDEMFANTVLMLAQSLLRCIRVDRRWRDFTVLELAAAIRALLAGFRVYRGYRRRGPAEGADREEILHAARAALVFDPRIEPATIHFVRDALLGDYPEPGAYPPHREGVEAWALTFQQYTGAVTAKAVEDTTYYTYNRLLALNEVGGEPAAFGRAPEAFHRANLARLERTPRALLASSTHDTKMSEDVRARLLALSEIPWEWRAWLEEWRALNAPAKTEVGGRLAPDADEEYRLYQTLLGAWPLPPASGDGAFRERMRAHLRKAVSEAKVNTSILHPNEAWLAACDRFVDTVLAEEGPFWASLRRAAERLARPGMVNALAQVALKFTVPGVPDLYQGNQGWDFSLVDPDNRRAVDHAALVRLAESSARATPADLLALWRDGGIKLALTRALLRHRREHPDLFERGTYEPLRFEGALAEHAVGFVRAEGGERLLVLAPRLVAHLAWPPIGAVWEGTRARAGEAAATSLRGAWRDLATGHELRADADGAVPLRHAFAEWPVAVLRAVSAE
jgi:(1->4)-alpha-D-glucan 1-alpha-D-glucosylmutase